MVVPKSSDDDKSTDNGKQNGRVIVCTDEPLAPIDEVRQYFEAKRYRACGGLAKVALQQFVSRWAHADWRDVVDSWVHG